MNHPSASPEAVVDDRPTVATREAHRPEIHHDVRESNDRVEHGDVDVLALAGHVAMADGREHADDAEHRGGDVTKGPDGRSQRWMIVLPLHLVDAGHPLHNGSECGPQAVGGVSDVAEPRHGRVDHGWMYGPHVLVTEPHPTHRPGLGVLGHDVEPWCQAQHEISAGRALEVDRDTPLAEVVAEERASHAAPVRIFDRGQRSAAQFPAKGFDLDDVGSEPGHELGGEGKRLHLLQRQDPHTGQWARRVGVAAVVHSMHTIC